MAIQTVKTGAAVNDGTGDDARTAFTKINQNFTDGSNAASRQVGTAAGNVMEVGAFGLGSETWYADPADLPKNGYYGWFVNNTADTSGVGSFKYGINLSWFGSSHGAQILFGLDDTREVGYRTWNNGASNWYTFRRFYHEGNTTKDSNGFLKGASPIVQLFAGKIELSDEAKLQPITFEKLGVGDYLVKGSLGFAQEGWYIEMPKDANGNVLVAVVYEQLDNNDISVKTYAKMFDEETGDIVANTAKPRDIPATRWIDLRLQALPQPDIEPFATEETTVATNAE